MKKAAEIALKDAAKKERELDKAKRVITLKKWKENDNGGLRQKILKLVEEGGPHSRHMYCGSNPMLSQPKVNQRIAKAKLVAEKRKMEADVHFPIFPLLLELPWFHGNNSPSLPFVLVHPIPQIWSSNWESTISSMSLMGVMDDTTPWANKGRAFAPYLKGIPWRGNF